MTKKLVFTQKYGAVYVQFGPGTEPHYLGDCMNLDSIPNPRYGGKNLIQVHNRTRTGYKVLGETLTPPGTLDFTMTNLLFKDADWLEREQQRNKCNFTTYLLQYCGKAGNINKWDRVAAVAECTLMNDPIKNVAHRVDDGESEHDYEVSAWPPRMDVWGPAAAARVATETEDMVCLAVSDMFRCEGVCGAQSFGVDDVVMAAAAGAGVKPWVHRSVDGLTTITHTAADPFTADDDPASIASFIVDADTPRILVVRVTLAATPLQANYSDDGGATWTVVNIGATNAEGATGPKSLFALDDEHIWVCTDGGEVYFSGDGGETWTAQNATTASGANALNAINFCDEYNGVAVGAADTVIYTNDGGTTWQAAAATALAVALNAVVCFTPYRWLIGSAVVAAGSLVMTFDGGATYGHKIFTGHGTKAVADISFINEHVGVLVANTAAPVGTVYHSVDGGHTWNAVDVPANLGLNACVQADLNRAYIVGKVDAGGAPAVMYVNGA